MQLILSHNSPINTVITTSQGEPLYKIDTPFSFSGRITSISRIQLDGMDKESMEKACLAGSFDLPCLSEAAHIKWKCFGSTKINFNGGADLDMKDYLLKKGFLWRNRVFTAPDGRTYRWTMGMWTPPVLCLEDQPDVVVARYHRYTYGIFRPSKKAYLEIYPVGEHILEAIVITFAYVEKVRRERERAARSCPHAFC